MPATASGREAGGARCPEKGSCASSGLQMTARALLPVTRIALSRAASREEGPVPRAVPVRQQARHRCDCINRQVASSHLGHQPPRRAVPPEPPGQGKPPVWAHHKTLSSPPIMPHHQSEQRPQADHVQLLQHKTPQYPLPGGSYNLEGTSSLWLPLPGKAIKLFLPTSP